MSDRFGQREIDAVAEVIRSGNLSGFFKSFTGGDRVKMFEQEFAAYLTMDFAVSFSSGTAALHAALLACGVKKRRLVCTTPYTFISTVSTVLMCGAKPFLVDVDKDTYNLDPDKLEEAIETHKLKPTVIMPVHLLGHPADMDRILKIAIKHDCLVIEDACQALESEYKHLQCGTMGDINCFSFQATKGLTTGGEGGMAVTDDEKLAKKLREVRNHGEKYADPESNLIGYNYRLTEMQAAFGSVQLSKLTEETDEQITNAKCLMNHLPKTIQPPKVADYVTRHSFFLIGAKYMDEQMPREQFLQELTNRGISQGLPGQNVSGGYNKLVYEHRAIGKHCRFQDEKKCPVAQKLLENSLWIDLHRSGKSRKAMERYAETFKEILEA